YMKITGTLDTIANDAYRLDFYWSATPGPGARGAARLWLGHASSGVTDASGHVRFAVSGPAANFYKAALPLGYISATATDAGGSTSEISPALGEYIDVIFQNGFEGAASRN